MKSYRKLLIKLSLFIVLLFAVNSDTKAQLGFKNVSFSSPDTLSFGDSIYISASLFNYDTVGFAGRVQFRTFINADSTQVIFPDTASYFIPANSGQNVFFSIPVSAPLFKIGPDVVIIWPYSAKPPKDNISKTVFVRYPLGVANEIADNFTAHWQGNTLKLDLGDSKENAQRVRIYALIGSVLYENTGNIPLEIPLQEKQSGIYLCEILWKNNTRKVVRFLLE